MEQNHDIEDHLILLAFGQDPCEKKLKCVKLIDDE